MRRKLWITYIGVIFIALLCSWTAFWARGRSYIDDQNRDVYMKEARMMGEVFENSKASFEDFAQKQSGKYGVRITLIDREGNVLADSSQEDTASMDRHDNRTEVRSAIEGRPDSEVRYSDTMKVDYFYAAVPVERDDLNGVLRISLPLSELKGLDRQLIGAIFASIFIACAAALVIAYLFSRYITEPMDDVAKVAEEIAGGNYGGKIYTRQKDQIGRLADAFNHMSLALKRNIESLTNRNNELEAILGSMTSAVVAIDDLNKILFSNQSFRKLLEIGERDLKGQDLYGCIRNVILFDVIDQVRNQSESCSLEGGFRITEEKIIRVTGTPLYEAKVETFGVLLVIEDITELKKLENMRTDFVSNVTHELKTPLTSIRGFVDTLKNGAIQDERVARKFLDIIDIESERLYHLIQDILLLSEIESKKDYDVEDCNVNKVIEEVVDLLAPKTGPDVDLIFVPEAYVKPFPCNPNRIKQLLINLVDNAIKSTEEGRVIVSAKNDEDHLVIIVEDTGIGIPKESQSRIFERFYRVDKGRSRKQGGTGLGLSIVKHIVEMYGGSIKLESEMGQGTKFTIIL